MVVIDFQIHDVLIRALRSPFQSEADFKTKAENFIKFFSNYESSILHLIQKYSGYEYTKDRIPVYLVPAGNSFLKSVARSTLEDGLPGVVQKLFESNTTNLHIFTHELVHVNQWQSDFHNKNNTFAETKTGDLNREGVELCADIVTLYVLRDLFGENSEYEEDFWNFLSSTNDVNKRKYEVLQKYKDSWDLRKKSLKEYIIDNQPLES